MKATVTSCEPLDVGGLWTVEATLAGGGTATIHVPRRLEPGAEVELRQATPVPATAKVRLPVVALALMALLCGGPASASDPPLRVAVDAATEDGWPVKALEDSAEDVRKKVKGKLWTSASADADVTITITNRYVGSTGEIAVRDDLLLGAVAYERGARVVEAVVTLRDGRTKAFRSGQACSWAGCRWPDNWTIAADVLLEDVEDWAKEHRDRILGLRP